MKICIIGNQARYEKFMPDCELAKTAKLCYFPLDASVEDILEAASDADVIFADAIAKVSAALISGMPDLKLVQSEGVAYNGIDLSACQERNVYVCNCKGINKVAVAEQALLLMLGLLRTVRQGHEAVVSGNQIARKEWLMVHGIEELSEQVVGLVGFGDIAKETAKRLHAFGAKVLYTSRTRKEKAVEEEYHVTYAPLDELLASATMVSLHVPVTKETTGMANREFFGAMRENAYFINTSRGELVENDALIDALESGKLKGAGLDTISPEPVEKSHPLFAMPREAMDRLLVSPHTAGVTSATFRRGHQLMWENAKRIEDRERPVNIVNNIM